MVIEGLIRGMTIGRVDRTGIGESVLGIALKALV